MPLRRRGVKTEKPHMSFLQRGQCLSRSLLLKEVLIPQKITTVFYGDSRVIQIPGKTKAVNARESRRVEFMIRKVDLMSPGFKVDEK